MLGARYDLSTVQDAVLRRDLQSLGSLRGRSLSWLPEVAFVRVDDPSGPARYFTLLRNTGHSNVSHVFTEGQPILPDEHTLTVVPGFIGSYPNALYAVSRADLPRLAEAIGRTLVRRRLSGIRGAVCASPQRPGVLGGQRRAARRLRAIGPRQRRACSITAAWRTGEVRRSDVKSCPC